MSAIKDILRLIKQLPKAEREILKSLLRKTDLRTEDRVEEFVTKERFSNGRICPVYGCVHVARNGHRKDGTHVMFAENVRNPLWQPQKEQGF